MLLEGSLINGKISKLIFITRHTHSSQLSVYIITIATPLKSYTDFKTTVSENQQAK